VYAHVHAYEDGTDSVPKRRHINFRRRGITQKKAYNIIVIIIIISSSSSSSGSIKYTLNKPLRCKLDQSYSKYEIETNS
jgi:hypothetical protein